MPNSSFMGALAKISLVAVLFGLFGFGALHYYLHVTNPSWGFWLILYGVSGICALRAIASAKPTTLRIDVADLLFVAFVGYVIGSFIAVGESGSLEFWARLFFVLIGPYMCGRILGRYVPMNLVGASQAVALIYLILLGVEFLLHPALFHSDRLFLFDDPTTGVGGEATNYNVGTALGVAWTAAFACLIDRKQLRVDPRWLAAPVFGLPIVLLSVGSRTSVASIVISAVVLLGCAQWIPIRKKTMWLIALVTVLVIFYNLISQERKYLIDDVFWRFSLISDDPIALVGCSSGGGSVAERIRQLLAGWQFFLQSPLFGIGATNFGLQYCDIEFGSPHSFLFHAVVETGLVGGSFLAFLLLQVFRRSLAQVRFFNHGAHRTTWVLFSVWLFVVVQVQFVGNLYYDYEVFLLTGLLISSLKYGHKWTTSNAYRTNRGLEGRPLHEQAPAKS